MDSLSPTENLARSRADMYHFLAAIYLVPPREELTGLLKNPKTIDAFMAFASVKTKELLNQITRNGMELRELVQEFNDLFIVPIGKYTTPYEAVFRDEREVAGKKVRGLLMGPSTVAVINCYRRGGAEKLTKELPDHIGTELGFMEYLCKEEARAINEKDDKKVNFCREQESNFLKTHLTQWLPQLVERISEKTKQIWYKAMANLTLDFINYDYETNLNCRKIN